MDQVVPVGFVGRSARTVNPQVEGSQSLSGPRLDRRMERFVENLWNSVHALAEEGSLFVAQTATPGTGIVLSSATGTTYSDTNGIVGINNLDTNPSLSGAGRNIIPLWLKLILTAAGTAGTDSHVASRLDRGARVSGGTQLTGKCVNPCYSANDDVAAIFAGAITIGAATSEVRNAGRAEVRKAAAPGYIVGDVIQFVFGGVEQAAPQAITPTTAAIVTIPMPAIVIPPGWSWVLNEWMTARTAAQSAEVELGYVLR